MEACLMASMKWVCSGVKGCRIGERVGTGSVIQFFLPPQDAAFAVPLVRDGVQDEHVVPVSHGVVNAELVAIRLKGRVERNGVKVELVGVETGRFVLGVNQQDLGFRPEIGCQLELAFGFAGSGWALNGQFELYPALLRFSYLRNRFQIGR